MTEGRTRPILHLKLGARPAALSEPEAAPAPKPSPSPFAPRTPSSPFARPAPRGRAPAPKAPAEPKWKCRPCGAAFPIPAVADSEAVRCPGCNAKLGLASDFRTDPPNLEKLRARPLTPRVG